MGTNMQDIQFIHALLAESDWLRCWQLAARDISIHALLAESDMFEIEEECAFLIFITLSLRRATMDVALAATILPYFYPRSPAESDAACRYPLGDWQDISIHALFGESDLRLLLIFLQRNISIHALLAESDHPIMCEDCIWGISIHALLRRATKYPKQ